MEDRQQIPDIVQKCVHWNAIRYDRVYDYSLAVSLLLEEWDEGAEAASVVDILDAVGDMVFVAMGVFWKLDVPPEDIKLWFYGTDLRTMTSSEAWNHCISINNYFAHKHFEQEVNSTIWPGVHLASTTVFINCLSILRGMGMQDSFYDIVNAICDSNNTKSNPGKTDPSVKANIDKGAHFVPPTARLQQIEASYAQTNSKVH